jgi:hypothetical protein
MGWLTFVSVVCACWVELRAAATSRQTLGGAAAVVVATVLEHCNAAARSQMFASSVTFVCGDLVLHPRKRCGRG